MLSGPSTICPFPPHGWSAPDGLPLLLRKQPIWAAGDTPHLPVEQGLPWHPVATGLAPLCCRCLPCARSPIPSILVPCSRCSSRLSYLAVPLLLVCCARPCPSCVAPAFCVFVLLLPLSVGAAPGGPFRAPPPVPTACPPPPPVRGFHISVRCGLSRARLAGHGPVATPVAGTSRRAGRSPRRGVRGHLVEGGGGVVDGSLGMRRIWWLLQCSHLMVPLCIVVCPLGARLTAVCGAALCPVALLLAFLPISGSFFFCSQDHRCWCVAPGGAACCSLSPIVAVRLSHFQLGGTRGTGHFCTCLQIYKLTCHWCLLGLF